MKKSLVFLSSLALTSAPMFAFAQPVTTQTGTLGGVIATIGGLVSLAMPVLIALAVLFFIYGIVMYVIGTDEETKKSARSKMIYGIIALVVIVGMWGIVSLITETFGISTQGSGTIAAPCIPGTSGC